MKREDFIFTVGYQGDTALVDGSAKRQYGRLTTRELAERGLLKPALASALHSGSQEEIDLVIQHYAQRTGRAPMNADRLKRTLGVFEVPDTITKIKVL